MDLDGVVFGSLSNSVGGDIESETRFHCRRDGSDICANYSGGSVQRGFLVDVRHGDGPSFRYVHLTADGEISSARSLHPGDDRDCGSDGGSDVHGTVSRSFPVDIPQGLEPVASLVVQDISVESEHALMG